MNKNLQHIVDIDLINNWVCVKQFSGRICMNTWVNCSQEAVTTTVFPGKHNKPCQIHWFYCD